MNSCAARRRVTRRYSRCPALCDDPCAWAPPRVTRARVSASERRVRGVSKRPRELASLAVICPPTVRLRCRRWPRSARNTACTLPAREPLAAAHDARGT